MLRIVSHEAATQWESLIVHTYWIALAHIHLTALPMGTQDFCLYASEFTFIYMCECSQCTPSCILFWLQPQPRSLSISLLKLLCNSSFPPCTPGPWGTTGCCVVRLQSPQRWKGWQRVSPQGSTGDRRRERTGEWKDGKKKKETRECGCKRSYSLWSDLTPQRNTVCEWIQKSPKPSSLAPLPFSSKWFIPWLSLWIRSTHQRYRSL